MTTPKLSIKQQILMDHLDMQGLIKLPYSKADLKTVRTLKAKGLVKFSYSYKSGITVRHWCSLERVLQLGDVL